MAPMFLASLAATVVLSVTAQMRNDDFPFYDLGTIPAWKDLGYLRGTKHAKPFDKEAYHSDLKPLDIPRLYESITKLMVSSKAFWPADGPQDGDIPSYAGLFGRLAWHCSGTFRLVNDTHAAGGCEGARQRHWPENEWRDNTNLDKARGLLGQVKQEFGANISWSDLITFAGTVALKASGGPKTLRFCFGRSDDVDGAKSIPLGVEGVHQCRGSRFCKSNFECPTAFHWPEQNEKDHARCNLTQPDNRLQASHSVGLIYVYPEGPELSPTAKGYKPEQVHQRSPRLSALEVRDTFHRRMGWTDRETVALIGGGHTLGRTHGNCNLTGTQWGKGTPYNDVGPYFEASPGTLRGPTDGTCGHGAAAGRGANTVSSGFEGPWTRTPSRWPATAKIPVEGGQPAAVTLDLDPYYVQPRLQHYSPDFVRKPTVPAEREPEDGAAGALEGASSKLPSLVPMPPPKFTTRDPLSFGLLNPVVPKPGAARPSPRPNPRRRLDG